MTEGMGTEPDLIIHGGKVATLDARDGIAEAIAVAGERIVAVGADSEILAHGGTETRRIDARGRLVTPGLIFEASNGSRDVFQGNGDGLLRPFVSAGYDVVGGEVWDSTDWSGWRNRTSLILEVLFGDAADARPAGLEAWLVE